MIVFKSAKIDSNIALEGMLFMSDKFADKHA